MDEIQQQGVISVIPDPQSQKQQLIQENEVFKPPIVQIELNQNLFEQQQVQPSSVIENSSHQNVRLLQEFQQLQLQAQQQQQSLTKSCDELQQTNQQLQVITKQNEDLTKANSELKANNQVLLLDLQKKQDLIRDFKFVEAELYDLNCSLKDDQQLSQQNIEHLSPLDFTKLHQLLKNPDTQEVKLFEHLQNQIMVVMSQLPSADKLIKQQKQIAKLKNVNSELEQKLEQLKKKITDLEACKDKQTEKDVVELPIENSPVYPSRKKSDEQLRRDHYQMQSKLSNLEEFDVIKKQKQQISELTSQITNYKQQLIEKEKNAVQLQIQCQKSQNEIQILRKQNQQIASSRDYQTNSSYTIPQQSVHNQFQQQTTCSQQPMIRSLHVGSNFTESLNQIRESQRQINQQHSLYSQGQPKSNYNNYNTQSNFYVEYSVKLDSCRELPKQQSQKMSNLRKISLQLSKLTGNDFGNSYEFDDYANRELEIDSQSSHYEVNNDYM